MATKPEKNFLNRGTHGTSQYDMIISCSEQLKVHCYGKPSSECDIYAPSHAEQRAFSSAGQSNRLITGVAQVRILEGPCGRSATG